MCSNAFAGSIGGTIGGIGGIGDLEEEIVTEEASEEVPIEEINEVGVGLFNGIGDGGDVEESKEEVEDVEYAKYSIALNDIGCALNLDEFTAIVEDEDQFYYIYGQQDGSIPYLYIGLYEDMSIDSFPDAFTRMMQNTYKDLDVDYVQEGVQVGNNVCNIVGYNYTTAAGYSITDTRIFTEMGNGVYMVGAKEASDEGWDLPEDMIEYAASSIRLLDEDENYDYVCDGDKVVFSKKPIEKVDKPTKEVVSDYEQIIFDEDEACYNGKWVDTDHSFKMYLPTDWIEYTVDESLNPGLLFIVGCSDDIGGGVYLKCSYVYDENLTDLDVIWDELEYAGFEVDDIYMVNDIPCIRYYSEEQDVYGEMFAYLKNGYEGYWVSLITGNYSVDEVMCDDILDSLNLK